MASDESDDQVAASDSAKRPVTGRTLCLTKKGHLKVYNDSTGRATSPSFTVPDHTQMEVDGEHADFTDHLAAGKGVDDLVLVSPVEVAALAAIRGADTDQRGTYTEDEFWLSRPELRHIQLFARARRAAPWAVLAVVLTRVVAGTSHLITIPPLIGGEVSLNIYIALVGKSGSGKDTAMAAGADAIRLNGVPFDEVTPGSGEGIAHAFMRHCKPHIAVDEHGRSRETTFKQYNTNALFIAAEIDSLAAMKNRNSSTIMPELRRAWMGDRLGFQYVDPEKRMPMPKHCYRLCLMVGVQPDKAAPLLDDAAGGTPQRFIWVQVTDPAMPDARPAEPPSPLWVHPAAPNGRQQIDICARAKHEIDAAHLARCRGDGDALDGHLLLCQLKTAVALALLNGRIDVTDDDWRLAAAVMAHSNRVRDAVVTQLAQRRADANHGRAIDEADRAVTVEEHTSAAAVQRVSARVIDRLRRRSDWMTTAEVRRDTASRDRKWVDEALEHAVMAGQVEVQETTRTASGYGGDGRRFRMRS